MFDQQNGNVVMVAQETDDVTQRVGFYRVKPGGRFVKADHLRPGTHGPGNFEPTLLAVRHLTRQAVGAIHQIHHLQPVKGPVERIAFCPPVGRGVEHARQQVAVHPHVLCHQ